MPHSLKLLQKYQCHINVERTQSGGAINYVYKYIFKPPKLYASDIKSQVPVEQNENDQETKVIDMVEMYRQTRRIGAPEAAARIFEHRNIGFYPPVEALEIHLPEKRTVLLRNPNLPTKITSSKLERYFARPSKYLHLTYQEYYEQVCFYTSKDKFPKYLLKSLSNGNLPPLDSAVPRNT